MDYFGKEIVINENVKFLGSPEDDPMNDPNFVRLMNIFTEVYSQPERLSPETSKEEAIV